jgi:DNA replication protein DnaC
MFRVEVPVGHPDFGKMFACDVQDCPKGQEVRARMWKLRLKSAQIPSRYANFNFRTFREGMNDEATWDGKSIPLLCCETFADTVDHSVHMATIFKKVKRDPREVEGLRVKNSLYLWGDTGMGKTGLAVSIINELARQGRNGLYTSTWDMLEEIQERVSKDADPSPDTVLKMYAQADVLILDECNIDNMTPTRKQRVGEVIDYRWQHALPTIITTNWDLSKFSGEWGTRIGDRVGEMAHVVKVHGVKLRKIEGSVE